MLNIRLNKCDSNQQKASEKIPGERLLYCLLDTNGPGEGMRTAKGDGCCIDSPILISKGTFAESVRVN